jgi:cellobiose phosphorylase
LGSAENTECKIDSIAQSWAVISGAGKQERIKEAFEAVEHYLIKKDDGLVLLLTPPFDDGDLEPGYIKSYLPGVRENGGQYTHAATWVALAYTKMGQGEKAWELFHMLNPINHASTNMEACRYKVEPYVMAADVYAVYPHIGRGGWTWYTGASSWMYRVGLQHILGFNKKGSKLIVDPCIPRHWPEYEMNYQYEDTMYHITIKNPSKVNKGVKEVHLDENLMTENTIELVDDRNDHKVEVIMG